MPGQGMESRTTACQADVLTGTIPNFLTTQQVKTLVIKIPQPYMYFTVCFASFINYFVCSYDHVFVCLFILQLVNIIHTE